MVVPLPDLIVSMPDIEETSTDHSKSTHLEKNMEHQKIQKDTLVI